ncbi:MAG: DNA topoisomerase IV subunit B, partial [Clostridia bacterium]|nr:DNA topoisomerase IV subunit B [Clostridia bacterium]
MDTAVDEAYGAEQIQVLEGLEAVRKRPGMYIGSTGPRGLHHLVYEIVDNSIDEALAGFCTDIDVEILPGDVISVRDNGRGIPVELNEKMNLPSVTVVLTVLHAGGKFGGSGYKVSGGLHGVGSSVVNALSEWLEVEVSRGGHVWAQRFERGNITSDLTIVGDTDQTGTLIRFKPDPEIFTETTVYEFDVLERRLRESAFLNAGLRITLKDLRDSENVVEKEYCYEGGVADFVRYLNTDKNTITDPIVFEAVRDGTLVRVAIQYTDSYTENIYSFVNNVPTAEGGSHETGFKAAVTKA